MRSLSLALLAATTALALAGCGNLPLTGLAQPASLKTAAAPKTPLPFEDMGVTLSDEQRDRMTAIVNKYDAPAADTDALSTALRAEPFDPAAFRTALEASRPAERRKLLGEAREVLTPDQRQAVIIHFQAVSALPAEGVTTVTPASAGAAGFTVAGPVDAGFGAGVMAARPIDVRDLPEGTVTVVGNAEGATFTRATAAGGVMAVPATAARPVEGERVTGGAFGRAGTMTALPTAVTAQVHPIAGTPALAMQPIEGVPEGAVTVQAGEAGAWTMAGYAPGAMVSFMAGGDVQVLETPLDAITAYVTDLSAEERAELADRPMLLFGIGVK